MARYTGKEGVVISNSVADKLIVEQESKFAKEEDYFKFIVVGKYFLEAIGDKAIAYRLYPVKGQIIIRPVDENGNEINVPDEIQGLKDGPPANSGGGSSPCPNMC